MEKQSAKNMYPRTNYEMTKEDLKDILDACKPTPVLFLSGGQPLGRSSQENVNKAWAGLGKRMGFDYMTVQPVTGKSQQFFTAVPLETEFQQKERLAREDKEKKQAKVTKLCKEINERQKELRALERCFEA